MRMAPPVSFASFAFALLAGSLFPGAARAQHGGHVMPDGTVMSDEAMASMDMEGMEMEHAEILGEVPGSGTSWLPEGTPAHAHAAHFSLGDWMLMAHGELFARYMAQNFNNADRWPPPASATGGQSLYPEKERGGTNFDAPNWAMLSAERPLFDADRLLLRAMLSLDPLTVGRHGYPLLYQTGEGLVDRQHAHDLFMELALLYAHPLGENDRLFAYLGLPGEPAVGPTAFMHRLSAGGNPEAPLAHHFQDATHITHGVATLGWVHRRFKAEVSAFRGREPDDDRWNIDAGMLNSYSLRLTQNFGQYSAQASVARIHDPEPGEHGEVTRVTASLGRHRKVRGADLATTTVYGMNAGHHGGALHSFLREASFEGPRGAAWVRGEALQRQGAELDLPAADADGRYWVGAATLGAGRTLFKAGGLDFFLAGQAALNFADETVRGYYGDLPVSAQVFLKVRPSAVVPDAASGVHHH